MGRRERERKRASRSARERPESQIHAGLSASRVTEYGGEPMPKGTWAITVSAADMSDGRTLLWHPPQAVAFSLAQAKLHCDRAVPRRRQIMGNLIARNDGRGYEPQNARAVLVVVADLWSAVLHAFAAVEALANDSIDRLPESTVVRVGKKEVAQSDMVASLRIGEKLKKAVPLLNLPGIEGKNIAGTKAWERFRLLKELR